MESINNPNYRENGLYKRWVWRDIASYYRGINCLKKIKYCIDDLNQEIKFLTNNPIKEVVFIISLVDWILDAYNLICRLLKPDVIKSFIYLNEEAKQAEEYFKAIRSFVVAHPFSTNRHPQYGLDGDMICLDIIRKDSPLVNMQPNNKNWLYIGIGQTQQYGKDIPHDFILVFYSKKIDESRFHKYMGASYCDLYEVTKLYIDKLQALDKYLSKQKRTNYIQK